MITNSKWFFFFRSTGGIEAEQTLRIKLNEEEHKKISDSVKDLIKLRQKRTMVNGSLTPRDDNDRDVVKEKDSVNSSLTISKDYYENNDSSSDESVIENQFVSEIDSSKSEYCSVDKLVKTDQSEINCINEDDFNCNDVDDNQQCSIVAILNEVEGKCQKVLNRTDQLMNEKKESLADEEINKIECRENKTKNDNDKYFKTDGQFQNIPLLCSNDSIAAEVIEKSNKALVFDVNKSSTENNREYVISESVHKNNDKSKTNVQCENAAGLVDIKIKIKNELSSSFEKNKNQGGTNEKLIIDDNNSKCVVKDDKMILSANGLRTLEIVSDIDDEFLISTVSKSDPVKLEEPSIQLPWTSSLLSKDEFLIKKSVKYN